MATDSSLTGLPEGLASALEERYGLARVEAQRRLSGGYANDTFLVEADGELLVVRVQRRPVDLAGLEWEHRLLRLLSLHASEVVAPIEATDGSTFFRRCEDAVVVLPYVDATPAERDRDRLAAAAALGRFHRAAAAIDVSPRPGATRLADLRASIESGRYFAAIGPRARPLPPSLAARQREIDQARDWVLEFVAQLEPGLTTSAIHGDFFRGNVLVRGGRVVALVDWEEANVDSTIVDLANAIWEFCKEDDDVTFRQALAPAFLHAYRDGGGTVPGEEDHLLIPLVRVRRILELIRAPYGRHVDWDYHLTNLEAFHRLG